MEAMRRNEGRSATETAILEATYSAVRQCGYAELSTQDIADNFDKSKSAIYYHYESKDDVLLSLLDYVVETFFEELEAETGTDPVENLRLLVDRLVPVPLVDDDRDFHAVMFELRSEALTNPDYRAKFTEVDRTVCRIVESYVRAAVEGGDVAAVDPEVAARRIQQHAVSAQTARLTTEDGWAGDTARGAILDMLELSGD
jgi:AcrR family transcriptional regulator